MQFIVPAPCHKLLGTVSGDQQLLSHKKHDGDQRRIAPAPDRRCLLLSHALSFLLTSDGYKSLLVGMVFVVSISPEKLTRRVKTSQRTSTCERQSHGSGGTSQANLIRCSLTSATPIVVSTCLFGNRTNLTNCDFQKRVYAELRKVSAGTRLSYKELSWKAVGNERAARAVGSAMRTNPYPLIVPCHRVIKSSGQLGRYAGGKNMKQELISHETRFSSPKSE